MHGYQQTWSKDKQGLVNNTVKSSSSGSSALLSSAQAENLSCPSGTACSGILDAGNGMHRTASATRDALAATAPPATASFVSSWKKTCNLSRNIMVRLRCGRGDAKTGPFHMTNIFALNLVTKDVRRNRTQCNLVADCSGISYFRQNRTFLHDKYIRFEFTDGGRAETAPSVHLSGGW